jgi:hypothetical protein
MMTLLCYAILLAMLLAGSAILVKPSRPDYTNQSLLTGVLPMVAAVSLGAILGLSVLTVYDHVQRPPVPCAGRHEQNRRESQQPDTVPASRLVTTPCSDDAPPAPGRTTAVRRDLTSSPAGGGLAADLACRHTEDRRWMLEVVHRRRFLHSR